MIAKNFRLYPDAQLAQLELDLAGVVGACEEQRSTWWSWLGAVGRVIELPGLPRPAWWVAAKKRAVALSRAVKAAILSLFNQPE